VKSESTESNVSAYHLHCVFASFHLTPFGFRHFSVLLTNLSSFLVTVICYWI